MGEVKPQEPKQSASCVKTGMQQQVVRLPCVDQRQPAAKQLNGAAKGSADLIIEILQHKEDTSGSQPDRKTRAKWQRTPHSPLGRNDLPSAKGPSLRAGTFEEANGLLYVHPSTSTMPDDGDAASGPQGAVAQHRDPH